MSEVTLDFIAEQLKLIQAEQRDMRTSLVDLNAGQTVPTDMVLRLARDMVQVKDLLGRMDNRIAQLRH